MMRQPSLSSRNHRNKGFRVRHALQIGLLVAVCLWLLYQVKHSHDKKLSMEEEKSGLSKEVAMNNKEVFNLGRKGLPQREEVGISHDTQDGEVDKEEEEKDGNKQEEAEEEDGGGAADDEIDEQDHEKGEEDEAGEELDGEEEKEIRDGESDFFEDPEDHDREAREESYKRDDVAGSIHRETQATEIEGRDEDIRASNEEHAENVQKANAVIQNVVNEKSGVSTEENVSDVGTMDNSHANVASGIPAISNSMPNRSGKDDSNDTSVSNNPSNEAFVRNNSPGESIENTSEQKENVVERKNLEAESSNLKKEASSNLTAVEPTNRQTDSNFSLIGVVLNSETEAQSSAARLDMSTDKLQQDQTVTLRTTEYHNSTMSLESKESDAAAEDAVEKSSTNTGLGEENSNFSISSEMSGAALGKNNASSNHMVTQTDLSTLLDLTLNLQ